jgi:hypothetical protein
MSDAEVLAANLTKTVGPRPVGHEAHHIIMKKAEGAEEAREILDKAGIGINDAENGIWLPKDSSVANPLTTDIHSKMHTDIAIEEITSRLREGAKDGPEGVRRALQEIRKSIAEDRYIRDRIAPLEKVVP